MRKILLICFLLLLTLSSLITLPLTVLADTDADADSENTDIEMTDTEPTEEIMNVTNAAETINIPVEIMWEHGFNEGPFPASVDIYLYDENGVQAAVATVDVSDGWFYTFMNLEPGDYTFRLADIEDYDIVYVEDEAGFFRVINIYAPAEVPVEPETMDIPVTIVWNHGDNPGPFPASVDIYLYDEAGNIIDIETVDASDGWQHTFTGMVPQDYTVREAAIENYDIVYARDEQGNFTVTNTYHTSAPETMDIPVEVVWDHRDNTGPFPASVDIYLFDEDGEELERITIDEAESWKVTFIDLEPGDYTVRQAAVENYDTAYARDESGKITITNTYLTPEPETIDIPVEVVWVHGANKGPFPASVDIYLYNEAGVLVDKVTVDASDSWKHTFTDLEPGEYTVREAAIDHYSISYSRDDAGKITITNTYIPVKNPEVPAEPEKPAKPGKPVTPADPDAELPATGTAFNNTILIAAGVLLLLGAGLIILTRRRKTFK